MKKMMSISPVVFRLESALPLTSRAIGVFVEEVALHTGLTLKLTGDLMPGTDNVVILSEEEFMSCFPEKVSLLERHAAPGQEGFRLFFEPVEGKHLNLYAVGRDGRGTIFAMGKLLRLLWLTQGKVAADVCFEGLSSTPASAMRGHQLGYRDKQNTLPCWNKAQMDRYIRDLILFGSNSIELLPPRTDDNLFSREMQVDPFEMMVHAAQTIQSYGMDVWLWYPNMGKDYEDPTCRMQERTEREKAFSTIERIDGVLIPAGDPGELEPEQLFLVAQEVAAILHKYHPHARVMLAPQCFAPDAGWYDAFYEQVAKQPDWLWGVCFAPWEKDPIEEMVAKLPEKYRSRIRHYPDITHDMGCQFALPYRDSAFAIIEGRECCDPRPRAMKYIHQYFSKWCMGSITYSEGVHDDVNKFVWGQQDWDEQQTAESTVREYVRYFIAPSLEDALTEGILELESSWAEQATIEQNLHVEKAYQIFSDIDARAALGVKSNWRYQQLLLRALADHYIQQKKAYDLRLESMAIQALEAAHETGAVAAIRSAIALWDRGMDEPFDPALRMRLQRLADDLRSSIGAKLTTHHHGGQRWNRGAWIDMIDTPLNDSQFFHVSLKRILRLPTEAEKQSAIQVLLSRTKVGAGESYVNVADAAGRALIVSERRWEDDPSLLRTPFATVDAQTLHAQHTWTNTFREQAIPSALRTCAISYYDTPLTLRIPGLEDGAAYQLEVAYGASLQEPNCQLTCMGKLVEENKTEKRQQDDFWHRYTLPENCVQDGCVTLTWQAVGKVRGVHVCELFLRKRT